MSQSVQSAIGTLRAITYRIANTSDEQLPQIAAQIAGSIWTCRAVLSQASGAKNQGDVTAVVHRFKTQLSTLLQHRNFRARWTGVVLVKAVIEAGGLEILSKSGVWSRNLLTILKRPDPPTTRSLTVLTLTRLFMLTWEHANLVREITTPALPGFVSTCISNIEAKRCSPDELQTVLDAFSVLIVRHSTIFRPNEGTLRTILLRILSSSSAGEAVHFHYTSRHRESARRLLVLLHHCTPKQGSSEKWSESFKNALASAHATCDYLFRGIEHDWESTAGVQPFRPRHQLLNGEPELPEQDALGLSAWSGIYAGHERLIETLLILSTILALPTPAAVPVKLGSIMDLLTRILSIGATDLERIGSIKFNPQIIREEREAVLAVLPAVRIAALDVVTHLLARFQASNFSILPTLTQVLSSLFQAERDESVRAGISQILASIVTFSGATFTRADSSLLVPALRSCCQQLLPSDSSSDGQVPQSSGTSGTSQPKKSSPLPQHLEASNLNHEHSRSLLLSALKHLPSTTVPTKVRAQIDRVAVITKDKDLLVASVLNPAQRENELRAQASLMPILARLAPKESEVEALIKPRMPVIGGKRTGAHGVKVDDDVEDEDDESDDEDDEVDEDDAEEAEIDGDEIPEAPRHEISSASILQANTNLQGPLAPSSSASQKRPFEPPTTESTTTTTPLQPSTTTAPPDAKRTRLDQALPTTHPTKATPATSQPQPHTNEEARSLLDDLEAQLQDDIANSNRDLPDAEITQSSSFPAAPTAETQSSPSLLPAVSTVNTAHDGVGDDDDDEMDGSDFEMPPLTMEMDTDDEDEEDEE